ncbi:hypothetical protein SAMN04487967_0886 [Natronorubrum sediminis]|uniref:Uncharacterized protein n=1 Tax=Natronorubrum sediminis TaxID=640943 RepID=A0A1H6FS64_9EURY|nr:hypothetical protein [Natronorubrum sediminis]SEH12614.1 hypothetical protein SAMN04487967_0886 [Natronorubrum sediminis]
MASSRLYSLDSGSESAGLVLLLVWPARLDAAGRRAWEERHLPESFGDAFAAADE